MHFTKIVAAVCFAAGVAAQRRSSRRPTQPTPQPQPQPQPTTKPYVPPFGSTQTLWGQCGGLEWTGAVACPTAASCVNDGENIWYSQCIPNSNLPDEGGPVFDENIATRTLTTIFNVPGPNPTAVTTIITYFTPKPTPVVQTTWITIITAVPDTPIQTRG